MIVLSVSPQADYNAVVAAFCTKDKGLPARLLFGATLVKDARLVTPAMMRCQSGANDKTIHHLS